MAFFGERPPVVSERPDSCSSQFKLTNSKDMQESNAEIEPVRKLEIDSNITVRQIAIAANVSHTTVSMALRDDRRVSEPTRSHVKEVARKLGYRTNPLASAFAAHLRAKREIKFRATLAFLLPSEEVLVGGAEQRRFLGSARGYAATLGYHIETIFYGNLKGKRLSSVLWNRNIPGVILTIARRSDPDLELETGEFAGVCLGDSLFKPNYHLIRHDHFGTAQLAATMACRQGYRRIGLQLAAGVDESTEQRYTAAAYSVLNNCGVCIPPLICDPTDRQTVSQWLSRYRPDAVLSPHIELLSVLQSTGISVPDNLGYVHLHRDSEPSEISGVDQRDETLVRTAINILVAQLHNNERGVPSEPLTTSIRGCWRAGKTLPARPRQ